MVYFVSVYALNFIKNNSIENYPHFKHTQNSVQVQKMMNKNTKNKNEKGRAPSSSEYNLDEAFNKTIEGIKG